MFHIMIAEFKLETNSFTKDMTTTKDYRNRNLNFGEEALSAFDGVHNEIGGFISFLKEKEDVEIIPAVAANATPGGKVARDTFELVRDAVVDTYRRSECVDGVLLSLHGAMVPDPSLGEDGEGLLLEALREAAGRDLPIFITLDLHANVTKKMAELADGIFLFDNYPHTDTYDRGREAAQTLYRTLKGELHPVMGFSQIPVLCPPIPTAVPPARPIYDKAQEYEKLPGVISVSVAYGYFYADIDEMGMAVVAITENDRALANSIAKEFAQFIWERRASFDQPITTVEEGVAEAMAQPQGPVVLADESDNPGGGSPGDSTFTLRCLLDKKAENAAVAVIYDPETVHQAIKAGVGATIEVRLGGKEYPDMMGKPIEGKAYVCMITDGEVVNKGPMATGFVNHLKPTVLLVMDGIEIIVIQTRFQPWDLNIFNYHGIEPSEKKIILVKSIAHYKAHYGTIAKKMINVGPPGLTARSPKSFTFHHLKHPVYPLEDNFY